MRSATLGAISDTVPVVVGAGQDCGEVRACLGRQNFGSKPTSLSGRRLVGGETHRGASADWLLCHVPGAPGIGRIGSTSDDQVRVDFFESAAEPIAESVWLPEGRVRPNRSGGTDSGLLPRPPWSLASRARGRRRIPEEHFVRIPNQKLDLDVPEDVLRVRWERPPRDPLQVLLSGANETPRFRDVREPVRRLLMAERAATAFGDRDHVVRRPHARPPDQCRAADHPGSGPALPARRRGRDGQDHPGRHGDAADPASTTPGRRIGVIVPDALVGQWRCGVAGQVPLSDFPTDGR